MREIEIKAKVTDREKLLASLQELGVTLSDPIKQHDRVFSENGKLDGDLDAIWLRIRTEKDKKHVFTLKRSISGQLDSIEHETTIENADELEKMILEMHYKPFSDLTKIRQKGKYGDIEICLDEVSGLGTFVEAEKMMDNDADHDKVVAELWRLLEKLGVSKTNEVYDGYDVLERKQRGL